jgi:hypothetical protein
MPRFSLSVLIAVFAASTPVLAADHEQMPLKPPKDYKVTAETKTDKDNTVVLLPAKQSAADWTERLTVQTLYRQTEQSPAAYRDGAEKAAAAECPGATFEKLKDGTENLYPMAMWIEKCPRAKDSGKPETTWWKAVQGRENFFLLRRTVRFEPDAKLVKAWTKFFEAARVCDIRVPGQKCKAP